MTATAPDSQFGDKAPGFDAPTRLPTNETEEKAWQDANRAWWEAKPMRYDWRDKLISDKASLDFFREIDNRFFSSVEKFLPSSNTPFDSLISYGALQNKNVLEIGFGHGSVAQCLAKASGSYTGIDLTEEATAMTRCRFSLMHLSGQLMQMDAEKMAFPDTNFDYIWSWGVIHHSANTWNILREMHRVLRPQGEAVVMVYYRSWWSYYLFAIMKLAMTGKFPSKSRIDLVRQQTTDGAIARFYTRSEWKQLTAPLFETRTSVHGMSIELIPLPHSRLKELIEKLIPGFVARFMTHNLAMGSFLVAHMRKR